MNISDLELQEVTIEYEATLRVPSHKPLNQYLVCPVGLIGSGKTTVGKYLEQKLSLLRISGDDIRFILQKHGLSFDGVYPIGRNLTRKYIEAGWSLYIDADCVSQARVDELEKVAGEAGVPIIWVHVDTPEDHILATLKSREKKWLHPTYDVAYENYISRKPLHKDISHSFLYTFDISKENFIEQIEEAVSLICEVTDNQIER